MSDSASAHNTTAAPVGKRDGAGSLVRGEVRGRTRPLHLAAAVWMLLVLAVVALIGAAGWQGARWPWEQVAGALLLTVPALIGAVLVRRRWPRVALALGVMATMQLVAFVATGWSSLLTMRGAPLIDEHLVMADGWLGFDAVAWIAWGQQWGVDFALWSVYHTLTMQMLLLVGLLAAYRQAGAAWRLALQLAVAGALTLAVFAFFPAVGPFDVPEAAPTVAQRYYLETFLALHRGEDVTLHLIVPTGLITFPSFHAAWALLVTVGYAAFPRSLLIVVPINAGVWLASVTHGCHYLVDLVAGGLIALAAMALVYGFSACAGAKREGPAVKA